MKPRLNPQAAATAAHLQALVGQAVDAIDTPALVVDLDAMERNMTRMADFAAKHQIRWRPTPRCTRAPVWPGCRCRLVPWACACRKPPRPKPWWLAVCPTSTSAMK
jgi:hypothetical protein